MCVDRKGAEMKNCPDSHQKERRKRDSTTVQEYMEQDYTQWKHEDDLKGLGHEIEFTYWDKNQEF